MKFEAKDFEEYTGEDLGAKNRGEHAARIRHMLLLWL